MLGYVLISIALRFRISRPLAIEGQSISSVGNLRLPPAFGLSTNVLKHRSWSESEPSINTTSNLNSTEGLYEINRVNCDYDNLLISIGEYDSGSQRHFAWSDLHAVREAGEELSTALPQEFRYFISPHPKIEFSLLPESITPNGAITNQAVGNCLTRLYDKRFSFGRVTYSDFWIRIGSQVQDNVLVTGHFYLPRTSNPPNSLFPIPGHIIRGPGGTHRSFIITPSYAPFSRRLDSSSIVKDALQEIIDRLRSPDPAQHGVGGLITAYGGSGENRIFLAVSLNPVLMFTDERWSLMRDFLILVYRQAVSTPPKDAYEGEWKCQESTEGFPVGTGSFQRAPEARQQGTMVTSVSSNGPDNFNQSIMIF